VDTRSWQLRSLRLVPIVNEVIWMGAFDSPPLFDVVLNRFVRRKRPEEIDGVGGQEGKKVRDYSELRSVSSRLP
jgi:hypothetical protein